MTATEYDEKPDTVKSSLLLHCIGERAREVYSTFNFSTTADSIKLEKIMEQFQAYFNPRKNITYSQFKFFTYRQEIGQSFDDYMTELRKLSSNCELEDLRESLLRDMLIIGFNDKKLQERLLRESNLDLNKTVEICRILEVTRSQAYVMQNNSAINPGYYVDRIRRQFSNNQKSQNESPEVIKKCKFCSFLHKTGSCPAYGKLCNNCIKKNYFAKCCNLKKVDNVHKYKDSSESDENSKIFENEALFIGSVSSENFTDFDNEDSTWS